MDSRPWISTLALCLLVGLAAGSGSDEGDGPTIDDKPPEGTVSVNLSCRNSGAQAVAWCGPEEECLPPGTEIWCPDEFVPFYPPGERTVNNWMKDGHWEAREDQFSVFSLFVEETRERSVYPPYLGKPEPEDDALETIDTATAYNDATIILFGEADGLTSRAGTTHGVGIFRGYSQNWISDDLYIEVVSWLSDEEYAEYHAQDEIRELVASHRTGRLENTRLHGGPDEELWDRVAEVALSSGEPFVRTMLRLQRASYDSIREAGEAARTAREERARPVFEDDAYARLEELAYRWEFDLDSETYLLFKEGNWALPTASRCGKTAPGDTDIEKKENESKRAFYREQLLNRYLLIDLKVEDPGDYDPVKKGFPVTYVGWGVPFVMSGRTKIGVKNSNMLKCCDLAGNCTTRLSCRSGEYRRNFTSSDYVFQEDIEKSTVILVDESELPNKPLGLTGEAIVRVQKVVRICPTSIDTTRYTGQVAAFRLMDGDEIVYEKVNVDLSLDDALKGRDRFLKEQIGGKP